ncbi:MAG: hypothetical protein COA99_14030 [Moraxellaceae bacterium]|nr:MAG: hypothetical protein COA99_14030 [Moraxellaceae bacterium]
MSEDLVLAILGTAIGILLLGMGFGFINQKTKPGGSEEQVVRRANSQKLFGWTILAIGVFNIIEVVGVL